MKRPTVLIVLSYMVVYVVWGSTYFFIKAAVQTIPPALVVGGRFILGAVILAVIAGFRGGFRKLPTPKELAGAAFLGILLLLLGNGLVTLAQKNLPSWVSSVVVACMPIYVAFYNLVLYRMRISGIRLGGALVGIAGVTLILVGRDAGVSAFGPTIFITVAGALCWALGTSLARSLPKPQDVLVSTAIQMAVTGLISLTIALAGGAHPATAFAGASAGSLAALAYLVLAGALAMVAYNHLLAMEPSFRVSSYSLVNPLIAVSLGFAAGEQASPWFILGAPLVLVGLVAILYGDALNTRFRKHT